MRNDTMSTENELPTIMSAKQVAAWLGLTEATVSRLLRDGKLPGRYFGTRAGWRVLRVDVEAYFAAARRESRNEAQP
jgi:excisionase family DNA binding protein